jgi:hypothetical protein
MPLLIDHGKRVVVSASQSRRVLHEASTRWGDHGSRRCGYRRLATWHSPLLGRMQRWAREFSLPEEEQLPAG